MSVKRDSNLELYRIVTMFMIVAHHYVANSGLMSVLEQNQITFNSIFLYLFGMWGKTGINCFVLITGYFMCQSSITVRKFLKLLLEVEFYQITIYLIFVLTGVEDLSMLGLGLALLPIRVIGNDFIACYLVFFLCIPFLNVLIRNLDKPGHQKLLLLGLCIYTLYGSVPKLHVTMNYVSWFCVLYIIGSYIRMYGIPLLFKSSTPKSNWGMLTLISITVSITAVIATLYANKYLQTDFLPYRWVEDSNKFLAVTTAVCSFMWFKELNIKYNPLINTIGACTFGILLIHAHSNAMRHFLWVDIFNNVGQFNSGILFLHAILSVTIVFTICAVIDYIRIRALERPIFQYIDKILQRYQIK